MAPEASSDREKAPAPESGAELRGQVRLRREPRFPWVPVGLAVMAVIGGAFALVRVPSAKVEQAPDRVPSARVGLGRLSTRGADEATREEAALRDPTPLFLPTVWNAGASVRPPEIATGPETRFQDYPAKLTNPASGLQLGFEPNVDLPRSPAEGLRVGDRLNPYGAVGRKVVPLVSLAQRLGQIDVVRTKDGVVVISESLAIRPELVAPDWKPMVLLVGVDSLGLVGSTIVSSSGVEDWDAIMRLFLEKTFRLGERLSPGFYRVIVGP